MKYVDVCWNDKFHMIYLRKRIAKDMDKIFGNVDYMAMYSVDRLEQSFYRNPSAVNYNYEFIRNRGRFLKLYGLFHNWNDLTKKYRNLLHDIKIIILGIYREYHFSTNADVNPLIINEMQRRFDEEYIVLMHNHPNVEVNSHLKSIISDRKTQ